MTSYTWTKNSGDFGTASNWSPNGVPGGTTTTSGNFLDGMPFYSSDGDPKEADTITLPGHGSAYRVTSSSNKYIGGFAIGANATLDIANNSAFFVNNGGSSTNSGGLQIESGSNFGMQFGTLTNTGRVYAIGGATFGNMTVANNGSGILAGSLSTGVLLLAYDTINQVASAQIRGGTGGTGGTADIVATTVNGGQIVARNSGGLVRLDDATINSSLLDTQNGGLIETYKATGDAAPTTHLSTLSGIQNTGEVRVTDSTQLALSGTINNRNFYSYSAIEVSSTGSETDLEVATGGATLTGNGRIILSDNGNNYILGTTPGTLSTLTNSNNTISGAGNIGVGDGTLTMANSGTILANGTNSLMVNLSGMDSSGNLTIGDLNNNGGKVTATGSGGLDFVATRVNGGQANIGSGSLMEFGSNESANLSFLNNNGTTGLLVLDTATKTSFAGTISNFSGSGTPATSDGIDLRNISFQGASLTATSSGGNTILEVSSATGRQVADLTLMGQYSASDFQLSADGGGHNGTLVTTTHAGSVLQA